MLTLAVAITSGCSRGQQNGHGTAGKNIQIKGSDTIVNLVQAWAEEFTKRNPVVNIGVTGGGSGTGFAALLNGTCDIGMSSRLIDPKEIVKAKANGIQPVEYKVGLDGLAVVVHPDNPVHNLTLDNLRDIFMARKKNWKDFGGENRKIVILSRESNSGTHVFFKEHVLKRGNTKSPEEFSPEALLMPSSQAIADEVQQNPHAIGYVGMGYICQALKAVAVAVEPGKPFIEPNVETVMDGSYPISRPLFLYTNGEPTDYIKIFVDYALSESGQKMVKDTDFVPIGGIGDEKNKRLCY